MKNFALVLFVLVSLFPFSGFSQKLYSTETGQITFFSSAPLEDISAVNKKVTSVLNSETGVMVFKLRIRDFKFPNSTMEEHFNENYLESEKLPYSEFKGTVTNIKDVDFKKPGVYNVNVTGKLTIHGVTKDVATSGSLEVKKDGVVGKTKFNVKLADHNIEIPKLVFKNIAEVVEVTAVIEYKPAK